MDSLSMTDEELSKELAEAVANQDKIMTHVETKATPSEVALKLKCAECGETAEFPACDDQQMELSDDGTKLTCTADGCDNTIDTPKHHDKPMVPYVVKAS